MPNQFKPEDYGFALNFGTWVRKTDLQVTIVYNGARPLPYGVYVSHGHPGGAYWRNGSPLVSCKTNEEAEEKVETLFGVADSAILAHRVVIKNWLR